MTPTKKTTQNLKPNPPNLKAPAPKSPAPTSPAPKSPAPTSPAPKNPAPKSSLTPAKRGQPGIFAKFRLLAAVAVFVLIVRLVVAGFWSGQESDSAPLSPLTKPQTSLTAPPAAEAALGSLPANAIAAGAAAFLNSQVAITPAVAQSAASQAPLGIPLPPGEEDLRRPQKTPPPAKPGPTTPAGPPLPPTASGPAAEEQAKKNFDLTRRETQLNAREQALKELEADLTVRLAAADKAKTELNELIARNAAILAEQKATATAKKTEEDALKEARVEHLVLAFKGMKPEQAGQLINSMDDQVAVSILSAMPGGNAGKILAMVQPDKAARLIKSISERRIDPQMILEKSQNPNATPSPDVAGAPNPPPGGGS